MRLCALSGMYRLNGQCSKFDVLLGLLLRHPYTKGIAADPVRQAFDRRARLLRQCAERLLSDQLQLREGLIAIINDACSTRGHRDNVIRCQWHLGRKKGKLGTAVTVIKRRPKFEAHIQNMSAQQVEDVASTISEVTARLIWWRDMNIVID
jgi:hypothetical protein